MNFRQAFCKFLIIFSAAITSEIHTDMVNFDKPDLNLNAFRNFINLSEKEISDNYSFLEQFFKSPKFDIDVLINSFYYSNFPSLLLDLYDKFNIDEFRSHKEFLK
jgi:hypothetical protein